uniref:Uncharacterized protein n=1 Tax=Solanum lycopersicum TaxID=4081 RepID=A0A494GA82_SOLLC
MPNVVQPSVQSKGGDFVPWPTSFDLLCCPRAVISCQARHRLTVCAFQARLCHATPDVIRPCVLSKGGGDGMPRPTSFDRVCHQWAMMAYDARRRLTMSATPRAVMACHARCRPISLFSELDVFLPVHDELINRLRCPKAMMAWHARRR